MKLSVLLLACPFILMPHVFAGDVITLKDGEVVQGEIVSATESQVVIKVTNASRTITSQRIIPASDIKDFKPETAQQKQERQAYQALRQLQIDPNGEFAKADYTRVIEAFGKYQKSYPESKYAEEARQRMAAWQGELSHVEKGEVKFASRWMTPEEKRPLWDRFVNSRLLSR